MNYLARKHNVHVIWAVTEDKFRLYSELSKMVEGSSAGVISSDSSNVVELVRKQYEVITTTIRVTANSSANCPTQIKSKCKGRGALTGWSNWMLHRKLKCYVLILIDLMVKIEGDLPQNLHIASISSVKSSCTTV